MADVLVDTDIFIDHLRGAVQIKAGRHRLNYSVITRADLLPGPPGPTLLLVFPRPSGRSRSTEPSLNELAVSGESPA